MGKIMEEKNKGTKKPKRNGTRPAKNSGKRIGKSRPEKADNARNRILKHKPNFQTCFIRLLFVCMNNL